MQKRSLRYGPHDGGYVDSNAPTIYLPALADEGWEGEEPMACAEVKSEYFNFRYDWNGKEYIEAEGHIKWS